MRLYDLHRVQVTWNPSWWVSTQIVCMQPQIFGLSGFSCVSECWLCMRKEIDSGWRGVSSRWPYWLSQSRVQQRKSTRRVVLWTPSVISRKCLHIYNHWKSKKTEASFSPIRQHLLSVGPVEYHQYSHGPTAIISGTDKYTQKSIIA